MPATAPAATPAATATPAEPPETGAVGIEAEGAGALTEPAPAAGLTVVGAVPEPGTVELCPDAVLGAGVVPGTLVGAFAPVVEAGAGALTAGVAAVSGAVLAGMLFAAIPGTFAVLGAFAVPGTVPPETGAAPCTGAFTVLVVEFCAGAGAGAVTPEAGVAPPADVGSATLPSALCVAGADAFSFAGTGASALPPTS